MGRVWVWVNPPLALITGIVVFILWDINYFYVLFENAIISLQFIYLLWVFKNSVLKRSGLKKNHLRIFCSLRMFKTK